LATRYRRRCYRAGVIAQSTPPRTSLRDQEGRQAVAPTWRPSPRSLSEWPRQGPAIAGRVSLASRTARTQDSPDAAGSIQPRDSPGSLFWIARYRCHRAGLTSGPLRGHCLATGATIVCGCLGQHPSAPASPLGPIFFGGGHACPALQPRSRSSSKGISCEYLHHHTRSIFSSATPSPTLALSS
jgi:hypothetical protein